MTKVTIENSETENLEIEANAVVAVQIKTSKLDVTVQEIANRWINFRFDLAIQRNVVWDIFRKSKLVESIVLGYPIPDVFTRNLGDNDDWLLDGKQRLLGALAGWLNLGFELDKEGNVTFELKADGSRKLDRKKNPIPVKLPFGEGFPLTGVVDYVILTDMAGNESKPLKLNGLTFNELDPQIKQVILNHKFTFVRAENITDEIQEQIFIRLNNGVPLKNMELTRALAGTTIMDLIEELSEKPLLAKIVNLSDTMRNRYVDDELVTQTLMLVEDYVTLGKDAFFLEVTIDPETKKRTDASKNRGFDGDAMKKAVTTWRDAGGYSAELVENIKATMDYMALALPDQQKWLKKSHLPALFLAAMEAIKDGIAPEKFGGYAQAFFGERYGSGSVYATAAGQGSAKKMNVRIRVQEMLKDYAAHIGSAGSYKAPIPKQNKKAKAEADKIASEQVVNVIDPNAHMLDSGADLTDTGEGKDAAPEVKAEVVPTLEAEKVVLTA